LDPFHATGDTRLDEATTLLHGKNPAALEALESAKQLVAALGS
jgi:hypothetical protein